MAFKFNQRYDLRMKDLRWDIRDSFPGAHLTDTKDIAQMKKNLARNQAIIVGLCAAIAFGFWLAR